MADDRFQNWYVKASFGAEWGPMSVDTLLEMADSGSFARDDLARCGLDEDWQPVPSVLDQLRSPTSSFEDQDSAATDSPPDDAEELPPDEPAEVTSSAPASSAPNRIRGGGLPGWSNYWTPEPSESPPPLANRPLVVAKLDRHDTAAMIEPVPFQDSTESPESTASNNHVTLNDIAADEQLELLETWKRERTERLDRLLKIVADREAAAARAAEAAQATNAAEEPANTDAATETTEIGETSSTSSASNATKSHRVTRGRNVSQLDLWRESLDRWKRSLPDFKLLLALLLIPMAAWWFWPESFGNAGGTYRTMYDELQELRERPNDKTGMEEFVQRSQTQLNEMIPWLQKRASSKDPETQWLLWMGRDGLRPMLKNPRTRDSKAEINFKKLLAEWERIHGRTPVLLPTSEDADQTPPVTEKLKPAADSADQ